MIVLYPHNRYSGLALEFKTPCQTECPEPSESQTLYLEKLQEMGFKTIVSNDLLELHFELRMYFSGARVHCSLCSKAMSRRSLARHMAAHEDNSVDDGAGDACEIAGDATDGN